MSGMVDGGTQRMATAGAPADLPGRQACLELDGTDPLLSAVVRRRSVGPQAELLRHGAVPEAAHVLLEGYAFCYRLLPDGRRQITAVRVPGDACDLDAVMRGRADCGVVALTACVVGVVPTEHLADAAALDPAMRRSVWRRLLREQAIGREWLIGMGRRTALERIAHLICELRVRLESVGLAEAATLDVPFTQVELADMLGLSTVHINRIVQALRRLGLIRLSSGTLTILDLPALEALAGFDPVYLSAP